MHFNIIIWPKWRFILLSLSFWIYLQNPDVLFMRVTCPAHLIVFDLLILIMINEK
jgi:hypothetical protein